MRQKTFTLIEIMVVIVITIILIAGTSTMTGSKAREIAEVRAIMRVADAMDIAMHQYAAYASTAQVTAFNGSDYAGKYQILYNENLLPMYPPTWEEFARVYWPGYNPRKTVWYRVTLGNLVDLNDRVSVRKEETGQTSVVISRLKTGS